MDVPNDTVTKTVTVSGLLEGVSVLSFCAGSFAGATGVLIGHPLDTLKVRTQTGTVGTTSGLASLRGLYSGMMLPLATTGLFNALNLGLYQNCASAWRRSHGLSTELTPLWVIFCSANASVTESGAI